MATVQKTFAFAADAEGLTGNGSGQQPIFSGFVSGDGNPAGCVGWTQTTKGITQSAQATGPTDGSVTWESWGVPSGATVNTVRVVSYSRKVAGNTKLTSHTHRLRIVNASGSVHGATDLSNESLPTATGGWIAGGGIAAAQSVQAGSQASSSTVALQHDYSVVTSSGGGSAAVDARLDQVVIEIDYTVAPPTPQTVTLDTNHDGIGSAEAFGSATVVPPSQSVTAVGAVATLEAFGTATISAAGGGGATTYASDDMAPDTSNGWGSADVGGAWSTSGGAAADYAKTSGWGTHTLSAAGTRETQLNSMTAAGDQEGRVDLRASAIDGTQGVFFRIGTRLNATLTEGYRFEVRLSGTGALNVLIRKLSGGSATTLRQDANALTGTAANDRLGFKWQIQLSGSDILIRYKVWDITRGDTEPATWATDYTDVAPGAPYTSAGVTLFTSQVTANYTGTYPIVLSFATFSITSIGGGGGSAQSVTAVGAIASAEAFGTDTVSAQATVLPSAVASAEAFGAAAVSPGPVSVAPTGIATGEAFGSAAVSAKATLTLTGIASAEAFGTLKTGLYLLPSGVATTEAFGTTTVTPGAVSVSPTGIGTAEAVGQPSIANVISITGVGTIASGEAFGSAIITPGAVSVSPASIGSAEAFGSLSISAGSSFIQPTGITSGEAFGTLALSAKATVTTTGIATSETFGLTVVRPANAVAPVGIGSSEAIGSPAVSAGAVAVSAVGAIASAEGFGSLIIGTGQIFIAPSSISSAESFGTLGFSMGPVNVAPVGITSGEAFGQLVFGGISHILAQGIPPSETFGDPQITMYISAVGAIPSSEQVPLPNLSSDFVLLSLGNIVSEEAFGTLRIAGGIHIQGPAPHAEVTWRHGGVSVTHLKPYVEVVRG